MSRPSERKPAPGRVVVSHGLAPYAESRVCSWYLASRETGRLHDALREHLRTEHAELWEGCDGCLGTGRWCAFHWNCTEPHTVRCPRCHGRGYVETERSEP